MTDCSIRVYQSSTALQLHPDFLTAWLGAIQVASMPDCQMQKLKTQRGFGQTLQTPPGYGPEVIEIFY